MIWPKFAGMFAHRSLEQIVAFIQAVAIAGYDPVPVAAVVELETRHTWSTTIRGPVAFDLSPGYAVGLLQFAPPTARHLGTSTWALEHMSFERHVSFVCRYYDALGGPPKFRRPVDYYLAGWGSGIGTDPSHVLARKGSKRFEQNRRLAHGKTTITTADLEHEVQGAIDAARSNGFVELEISD